MNALATLRGRILGSARGLGALSERYDRLVNVERLEGFEADAERFRCIRLRALAEDPDAFGTTLAQAEAREPSVWLEQVKQVATFIASNGDEDVGLVRGAATTDRSGVAIVLSLWVWSKARGKGVGEALLGAVRQWAKEQGFKQLVLEVGAQNLAAIRLYKRLGFAPTGRTTTLPPPRDDVTEHERALDL